MTTPPEGHPIYGPAPYSGRQQAPDGRNGEQAPGGVGDQPAPDGVGDQPGLPEPGAAAPPWGVGYGPSPGPPAGPPPGPYGSQPGYPLPAAYGPPPGYRPPDPTGPLPVPAGWAAQPGWTGPPSVGQPPAAQPPSPYPGGGPRPAFPHPEPQPYHLMFRTWDYAWWRPVVGLFALVAGMLLVIPVVLLPVLLVAAAVEGGEAQISRAFSGLAGGELTPSGLLYLNLTLAGLILWTWLLVRVLHSLRPRWLSSVGPKLRWPYLFACLGLAVIALIAQVTVGALVPGDVPGTDAAEPNPVDGRMIALLVIILLTTPLQAAGEEYAFRGYLLQGLGALLRNRWLTIVLTALLFAAAHLQFDPPLFIDRFLFGLVAAWLVIRTGGLEAGIALHVLNNYLALGFAVFFDDLTQALNPGDISWWNVPVSLTQSLVYAALAAWVAGRMGLQTRTRPPAEKPPPDQAVDLVPGVVTR